MQIKIYLLNIKEVETHENLEAVLRTVTSQLNPNYDIIINQEHSKFNPSD